MAVTAQSTGPYAPGSAIIGIIRRYRDKGLTIPFTAEVLTRASVPESLGPRTMQALQTLDLIDDKGMPTQTLQQMRTVSEPDFQQCLADWVRSAYAEIFQFVDPAKDNAVAVRDAFRPYSPTGQQDRMVSLFLALCAEAGIVDESKKSESKPAARKPQVQRPAPNVRAATLNTSTQKHASLSHSALHPALAGLMQSLPSAETGWTKEQRDRFVVTFQSVLDFVIPVVERPQNNSTDEVAQ